jgi:GrpB-like predicted nucleotidyltransferase (UPF0157 family)
MAIHLADYDAKWPDMFDAEAQRLRALLDGVAIRIDHVGSTAVSGLAAKPVIDIQVSVARLHPTEPYQRPMESLGYSYTTTPVAFFHKPSTWPHTHHVHVREAGSHDEWRMLAFRDWLRVHASDRLAYEALKRALASATDADTVENRIRYSEAKTDFVREIERRAQSSG